MKRILILAGAVAAAASLLTGCASDQAYLKAQADAAVADGNARVAEANARAEEARAVIALSAKVDAGGAAGYLIASKLGGLSSRSERTAVAVARPRDWLDYLNGVTSAVATLGNIAVPIVTMKEAGKTSRAGFDRDVRVEEARQGGETSRITSVAQIARDVAANQPTPSITNYTLSGNGVIGNGTYTVTTNTTTTNRNCQGGTGAAGGGTDTAGPGGTGGSGQGGTC